MDNPVISIAENVGGRKRWRIQLFRLLERENFGEPFPNKYGD